MNLNELTEFLKGLAPPEGTLKPELDKIASAAIETAYKSVWKAHWWMCRQRFIDLTTTASQAYVDCPKDFDQGILLCREGSTQNPIPVISPKRFFDDHPYPAGESTGHPSEAALLYDGTWTSNYRLYLWPVPGDTYTLPMLYLRKANLSEIDSLGDEMVEAVVIRAKYQLGYVPYDDARAVLEEAIEHAGGFIMPPGRMGLEAVDDLSSWPHARSTKDGPDGWYVDAF